MASFQEIKSTRLSLAPFSEDYLTDRYCSWLNDPEVVKYSEQRHLNHTIDSCRSFFQAVTQSPDQYLMAIVVNDEPYGHIGNIMASVDRKNALAEITILIGEKEAWGRGYGTEAWQAVMTQLFELERVRKIAAGTLAPNRGMLQIMTKCGMKEEARFVRHYLLDGEEVDVIRVAAFRDTVRYCNKS